MRIWTPDVCAVSQSLRRQIISIEKEIRRLIQKDPYLVCALIFGLLLITPTSKSYGQSQAEDVVLYAWQAPVKVGTWNVVSDSTAASGMHLADTNLGFPKLLFALPNPPNYFEMN